MTVKQVQFRLDPYSQTILSAQQINETALADYRKALNGPRTHQGFTGVLSYNHDDYDRINGFYWIACVDDRVVQIYVYDE